MEAVVESLQDVALTDLKVYFLKVVIRTPVGLFGGRVNCEVRGARCEEGIVRGSVRGGTRLVGYK